MKHRVIGGASLSVALLFFLGWWFRSTIVEEAPVFTGPSASTPKLKRTPVRRKEAPVVILEPGSSDPTPLAEANRLIAEERGLLHVRCFVGGEYTDLRDVEGGWFSMVTVTRKAIWRVKSDVDGDWDTLLLVRWDAMDGDLETKCTPEPLEWAEVVVEVFEGTGAPAPGVAVVGCGGAGETDSSGVASIQVMANQDSCTLDIVRMGSARNDAVFARIGTLNPTEVRHLTATLTRFDNEEGQALMFDYEHDQEVADGTVWVRDLVPPAPLETATEAVDRLRERQSKREQLIRARDRASFEAASRIDREIFKLEADTLRWIRSYRESGLLDDPVWD